MAAWGLVHGLAHLIVDGLFPSSRAAIQAEEILAKSACPAVSVGAGRIGLFEAALSEISGLIWELAIIERGSAVDIRVLCYKVGIS